MGSNDPTSGGIKAIETRYAGCRFRSRLEARWAVFFDTLGIPWEYEPEGFELPLGRYLPDFRLRPGARGECWLEIKGTFPSEREQRLLIQLAEHGHIRARMLIGSIPDPSSMPDSMVPGLACATPVVATWEKRQPCEVCDCGELRYPYTLHDVYWVAFHDADPGGFRAALQAARSARFEHGERGR